MKYPKLKGMMPSFGKAQKTPSIASPKAPKMPKVPAAPMVQTMPMATPAPTFRAPMNTVPSASDLANKAAPIELGDPERMAKVATLLRMGRR